MRQGKTQPGLRGNLHLDAAQQLSSGSNSGTAGSSDGRAPAAARDGAYNCTQGGATANDFCGLLTAAAGRDILVAGIQPIDAAVRAGEARQRERNFLTPADSSALLKTDNLKRGIRTSRGDRLAVYDNGLIKTGVVGFAGVCGVRINRIDGANYDRRSSRKNVVAAIRLAASVL